MSNFNGVQMESNKENYPKLNKTKWLWIKYGRVPHLWPRSNPVMRRFRDGCAMDQTTSSHRTPRATLLCLVDLLHEDLAVNHKSLRISCVCLGTTYMLRVYVYVNMYIWICICEYVSLYEYVYMNMYLYLYLYLYVCVRAYLTYQIAL